MTDADVQPEAHDAFDRIEEQFNDALDASLGPVGPDALYRYVAEMGFPAGATAIDVGCGRGEHTLQLSRRFGLHVTGIDPTARRMEVARGEAQAADHVQFASGSAESLPIADRSVDLIWCRDVLCLVEDLDRAYAEFRRVLKPNGRALIYQMYATDRLEQREAEFLLPVMGCSPAAMRPENTDAAVDRAGLHIDRCVVLGTDWGEYAQEHATAPGRHLLHAARLIRDPARYVARFGEENYDIKLGDCLWHIYRMIGKLSGRVYLLSPAGADTVAS